MSRPVPADLAAHLAGEVTTLAILWRIVRRDGVVLGFTSHDRDVEMNGVTYRAAPSFLPSALVTTAGFEGGDIELSGLLAAGAIAAGDLANGRYDFARLYVSLVNWARPGDGTLPLAAGTLGAVRWEDGAFRAELATDSARFGQAVTESFSPECRADLGDRRCRVDLARYRITTRVTAVLDRSRFMATGIATAADWYAYGRVRWITGGNAGLSAEVRSSGAGLVQLREPMRADIMPGDILMLTAGCDRRFATCSAKFNNSANFRGEPHVPGLDAMLDYPDAR